MLVADDGIAYTVPARGVPRRGISVLCHTARSVALGRVRFRFLWGFTHWQQHKVELMLRIQHVFGLLMLPAVSVPGLAQVTGSIQGTVVDATSAAVPSAKLVLANTATGQTREVPSSSEGYFIFVDLGPATYQLKVSAPGFKELLMGNLALNVGQQLTVRPKLELGAISERVEVSAVAPPVTTTSSSVAQTVDTQRIERLPLNGRNALQLIALVPA